MGNLADDEPLAEAIADVALDLLTRLEREARRPLLASFEWLVLRHGRTEAAELLKPDPH
jgi:hypothetical protein